jgi:hypothetical protein
MRRQKTFQLCLNSYLFANMICDRAGPKDVRFTVAVFVSFGLAFTSHQSHYSICAAHVQISKRDST